MAPLLLILALIQGIPIAPQVGGTVSGMLRNAAGRPAAKVRVSAKTQQDSAKSVALASLAETDEDGRYTLENIPPGQYYIVAGNIDRPTYYPGTQDMTAAKVIQITSGLRVANYDFVVIDTSRQLSSQLITGPLSLPRRFHIDLRVVAASGRVPASSSAGPVTVEFGRLSDGTAFRASITAAFIDLELLTTGTKTDYRVRVLNLPDGFTVSAITFGNIDASSGALMLPADTSISAVLQSAAITNAQNPAGILGTSGALFAERLTITIAETPVGTSPTRGVRVTGLNRASDTHPVFLSGRPGTVFTDGTFEFRDVPSGRHVIASIDFPGRALGTTLIVGEQNIDNITLDDIAALPTDIQIPMAPGPAGNASPGSRIRPVVLRGVVLDRMTRQPPTSGQVYISGRRGPSYHLDAEGKFEVDGLLPGTYELEVQVAGYPNTTHYLKVDVEDIRLDLEIEK